MLEFDKTLILFGRSPFINSISDYIPELCEKYHTMGCNYFVNSFPMVEYVIFYDDLVPDVQTYTKIVTNLAYYYDKSKKCYELLRTHGSCEFYKIKRDCDKFSKKPNTLHFCIHTPSMALNWAWFKGYKNVVIAGIDLTLENRLHFDKDTTPDADSNDFNKPAIQIARNHLENIATRHLNVYQLNPDSDLKIPKITIKDLL